MKRTLGLFAVVMAVFGFATTAQATLNVEYTRSVAGLDPDGYFIPGTTQLDVTISVTSTLSGADTDPNSAVNKLTVLAYEETLPAGWSYNSLLPGAANPTLPPNTTTGTIGFSWITPPAIPFSFTYRINVPANETGPKTLTGVEKFRTNGGEIQFSAPDVLFQEKPTVVSLARAVSGPGLTGASNQYYVPGQTFTVTITLSKDGDKAVSALGIDDTIPTGWTYAGLVAGDADNPTIPPPTNTGTISFGWITPPAFPFDFSYNITIPANETANDRTLTAVAKYRFTGAEILSNTDVLTLDAAPCTAVTMNGQGGDFYSPDASKIIEVNVTETCTANISALGVYQTLPTGWTYTGLVAGDGDNPTIPPVSNSGTIQFGWISAPVAPFTFAYTVSVPANELGDKDISGYLEYRLGGGALFSDSYTLTLSGADVTAPVITISGNATETVECGTLYTDAGATASDDRDGDVTGGIVTVDSVDATTPGTYTVTYNVSDAAGNAATEAVRTVTVEDTTAPVITLNGNASVTVECGGNYTEDGASVSDTCDAALSGVSIGGNIVDTTTRGTYTVTYDATDASGNSATQVTRTVTVSDTTAPTITVLGGNVTIECQSAFNDPGTIVDDVCEGSLSATVSGTVDVTTPGTYTLTYDAQDTAGNAAISATRTVTVSDTTAPNVAIIGDATVSLECGAAFSDAGATVTDTCDTAATVSSDASTTVISGTPGDYVVTYTSTDASGNTGSAQRLVEVRDTTAPNLTLNGADSVTIECNTVYTDAGGSANDTCDSNVQVGDDSANTVNTGTPGTYIVTVTALDDSGNVATLQRTVVVEDTTAPTISLSGSSTVSLECGAIYSDAGATALDSCEGDITNSILAAGSVDTATPGTYTLTFDVSDSSGNNATQVTRTVTVGDSTSPVVTVTSGNDTIECGGVFTDAGATATDSCEGDLTAQIVVSGDTVDTATPGDYVITYTVADSSSNTGTASRTVTVADTTQPVITVLGNTPETIECGSSYTDAGATVADTCDTAVTVSADTSAVNTAVAGSYSVTYTATDAAGNTATAARTVNVTDTGLPTITLNGNASVSVECNGTYTEEGATASDACDTAPTVSVSGNVDTTASGTYTVTYTATDASGNSASTTRTVTVNCEPTDTCEDANGNGIADNIFACLDSDGESLLLDVEGGTCTRRVYAVTWFGDVEGADITAAVANPNDENQTVTASVGRDVIGAGQQAILVVSISCTLADLLGDQAFNLGTTPDGEVAGNAWFDVSIIVSNDGGATYEKLDNSILETNPVTVQVNGLAATPGSSVGFQSYSTYIAPSDTDGAVINATDGASWTDDGINDDYDTGTLTGETTHLSVFGAFEQAAEAPAIEVTPNPAYDFIVGIVQRNNAVTNTITVKNTGGGTLTGTATINDPASVDKFSLVGDATFSLAPGASDTITVRFAPGADTGNFTATLTLANSAGAPVTVTLKGTGTVFDKKFQVFGCSADGGASGGFGADFAVVALALGGLLLSSRSFRRAKQS